VATSSEQTKVLRTNSGIVIIIREINI